MTDDMKPFSGMLSDCVKCGQRSDATITYHREHGIYHSCSVDECVLKGIVTVPERLSRLCGHCGYSWDEAPIDAEEKKEPA